MTTLLSRAPTSIRLIVTSPSPRIGPIHILSLRCSCHDYQRQGGDAHAARSLPHTRLQYARLSIQFSALASVALATVEDNHMNRRNFLGLGAASTVSLASAGAWSQAYPA